MNDHSTGHTGGQSDGNDDGTARSGAHAAGNSSANMPLGTLISRLLQEVSDLLRGELRLAREEAKQHLLSLKGAAICFGLAAAFAFIGCLALLACLHFALVAAGLPPYAAAGSVAGVALCAALICVALANRALKDLSHPLRRTGQQAGEDMRLIKESLQ